MQLGRQYARSPYGSGSGWLSLVCCTLSLQPAFALRSFYKRTYVITRVLDARTFDVGRLGRVRLLGVAPAQNVRFADQAWREAGEYCQANLVGTKVRLETDLQKSNIDGQRLVYLYLEDGTLFNLELIRAGYATAESNALRQLTEVQSGRRRGAPGRRGVWSEGQVFKSAGLPARSILSTSQRRVAAPATAPAARTDRQSERRSALQALQSPPPAAPTAPPPTDNPPHLTVDKPAAELHSGAGVCRFRFTSSCEPNCAYPVSSGDIPRRASVHRGHG